MCHTFLIKCNSKFRVNERKSWNLLKKIVFYKDSLLRNIERQASMAKSPKAADAKSQQKTMTIDGEKYSLEDLSESAKKALNTLQFADRKRAELNGEIALVNTARLGMINILKNELKKV